VPQPYDDYRWSRFRHFEAKEMYDLVAERVFPFLRSTSSGGLRAFWTVRTRCFALNRFAFRCHLSIFSVNLERSWTPYLQSGRGRFNRSLNTIDFCRASNTALSVGTCESIVDLRSAVKLK
jgi:hypothetical protein